MNAFKRNASHHKRLFTALAALLTLLLLLYVCSLCESCSRKQQSIESDLEQLPYHVFANCIEGNFSENQSLLVSQYKATEKQEAFLVSFAEEAIDLSAFDDPLFDEQGHLVYVILSQESQNCFNFQALDANKASSENIQQEAIYAALCEKGWYTSSKPSDAVQTYVKDSGAFRWLLLSYTKIGNDWCLLVSYE